jgi:hypothetical protein
LVDLSHFQAHFRVFSRVLVGSQDDFSAWLCLPSVSASR